MRSKILFIALLFSYYLGHSQQLPHYSLYMWNNAMLNPAAVSAKKQNEINFMARNQWVGFSGAPKTQSVSYYNINRFKLNAGTNILYDQTGPISILKGSLDFSYLVKLEDHKNKLSVGISANLLQYKIDNSLITLENDGVLDPTMLNETEKVLSHSFGAGIFYYNDNFYLGFSTSSIINKKLDIRLNNELIGHYYLQGGYDFSLGNNYKISPSILLKTMGAVPPQLDAGTKLTYNDMISFGMTYRSIDALVALFGLDFGAYSFGYGYDITTSAMKHPSSGSHELILSYRFETVERDTDKDGVIDEIDECPNKKGLLENNGCPDYDKDGVIDKNDNCPDFPGLQINDGCPDSDKDGVIDKYDKCRDIPGLKYLDGCPDKDKDGIADYLDRCPDIPGILKYIGCPDTIKSIDTIYKPVILRDTIYITTTDTVKHLKVDNIYFDVDKADIKQKSKIILDKIVEYLKTNPTIRLRIEAHTSAPASYEYNILLSQKRAFSVKLYLEKRGVSSSRLQSKGYGEASPIANNNTEEGRAKNRRVVFVVLE